MGRTPPVRSPAQPLTITPATRARLVLALVHPLPSLATTGATVAFALLFGLRLNDPRLWRLALIMVLAQFSISAMNDWADRQRDAEGERRRPLVLGVVSPGTALAFAIGCGSLALIFVTTFGVVPSLLVLLGIGAGWAYDLGLKASPFSFVPFAVAFPLVPLWGGAVTGRPGASMLMLLAAGVPVATAIHLADAIPDREVDAVARARTLAVALGRPKAELAVFLCLGSGTTMLAVSVVTRPAVGLALAATGWAAATSYLWLAGHANRVDSQRRAKWIAVAGALLVTAAWLAAT